MPEPRPDDTNPGTTAAPRPAAGRVFQLMANAVGALSVLFWGAVAASVGRFPDIATGALLGVSVTASVAACILGLRAGQVQVVDETRRLRKQHEMVTLSAAGDLAALGEQVADLGSAMVTERERYASAVAHAIARQQGTVNEALGQLGETVAAGYARLADRIREQRESAVEDRERRHTEMRAALGVLAAEFEQLSTKIGDFWQGYTAAVHDVNGVTTLPVRQIGPRPN